MKSKIGRIRAGLIASSLMIFPVVAETQEREQEAVRAAVEWLELVDDRQYDESWEAAAEYLQNAVNKDTWAKMAAGVRDPLGVVVTREVQAVEYRTTLPGAPEGEYVVILFSTSFENKRSAVETVTPMRGKDGVWKVSGYYVQ